MTLSQRARRASAVRPDDHTVRAVILAAGIGLVVAGAWYAAWPLAVLGSFAVGLTFSRDPERYYMEGFADGSAYGEQLAADQRGRDEALVRGLREDPRQDEPGAADGRADKGQRGPRVVDFASPVARPRDEGRRRVPAPRAVFENGEPNTAVLDGGPRPGAFAAVPERPRSAGGPGEPVTPGGRPTGARAGKGAG